MIILMIKLITTEDKPKVSPIKADLTLAKRFYKLGNWFKQTEVQYLVRAT